MIMELLGQIINGFITILHFANLLAVILGVAAGVMIGALPGLTGTMAVVILTPVTFTMPPEVGISLLLGVFVGSIYGGSISAILLRTPGTPAAIVTVFDGYPLAQQGKAGQALYVALFSSVLGGLISASVLITIAPQLAKVALSFGPEEYFGLTVFGISIIAYISSKRIIKGLIMGLIGILLSIIGMDMITGVPRFTFGSISFLGGIDLMTMLIGFFAAAEVLNITENSKSTTDVTKNIYKVNKVYLPIKQIKSNMVTIVRSSFIGTFIGIIPGAGASIASFISYTIAKRFSKKPENYGSGSIEGIAAAESANNAMTGGALIPMMTLGIPGDPVTAVLIGAFMIQGLQVGPLLFREHSATVFALFAGFIIANIFLFFIGLIEIHIFARIANVQLSILGPIIMVLCFVGSFAIRNSMFDVGIMLVMSLLGYFLRKHEFPGGPLVIGFILGPMMEKSLRQSLTYSNGNWSIFVQSPVCLLFLVLTLLSLVLYILKNKRNMKNEGVNNFG